MANFNYVQPGDVKSPRDYVKEVYCIYDGTANNGNDFAIAVIKWKDEYLFGIRWNRTVREACNPEKNKPDGKICLGLPVSHTNPTWFILPKELNQNIIDFCKEHEISIPHFPH